MRTILPVLKDAAPTRSFNRKSIILYQGEVPRQAFVIKRGTVKVYRIDNHGNELIINFHTEGDILPDAWIYGQSSSTLFYYEALEDCEIYALPKAQLLDIINENQEAQETIFQYFLRSHTSSQLQVNALNQTRATDKVKLMVYFLLLRFGRQQRDGRYFINFKITHSTFASLTGLTRETSTIELKKLRENGHINYQNSRFVIDRKALENSIGDESFTAVHGSSALL